MYYHSQEHQEIVNVNIKLKRINKNIIKKVKTKNNNNNNDKVILMKNEI